MSLKFYHIFKIYGFYLLFSTPILGAMVVFFMWNASSKEFSAEAAVKTFSGKDRYSTSIKYNDINPVYSVLFYEIKDAKTSSTNLHAIILTDKTLKISLTFVKDSDQYAYDVNGINFSPQPNGVYVYNPHGLECWCILGAADLSDKGEKAIENIKKLMADCKIDITAPVQHF